MRHGKKFNHLKRTSEERFALLASLSNSLILHKRINTTLAKAKALRKYVEPLITRSKDSSTHSRRIVFSYLKNKEVLKELFNNVADNIRERHGGYTRIIRTGYRLGDNAEMCMIELVDYNKSYIKNKKKDSSSQQKPARRRRTRSKKDDKSQITA